MLSRGQEAPNKGRISPNRGQKFPAEPLTEEEVDRLLWSISGRSPSGLRNRALIALLYRCGLRISEALSLRPKDLDMVKGIIRVLHGKGNKSRAIGIGPGALAIVERWMERRQKIGLTGRHPIFCTISESRTLGLKTGSALKGTYVRVMLQKAAKKAHIEKRVHPHGLRHSFAYQKAMKGESLLVIQGDLGHSSVATTNHYLQHLIPLERIEKGQKDSWEFKG